MIRNMLAVILLMGTVMLGQNAPKVTDASSGRVKEYRPGDPMAFYVKFKGPVDLQRIRLTFLLAGNPSPDQDQLQTRIYVDSFAPKLEEPGLFLVSATAPRASSGSYNLGEVYLEGKTQPPYSIQYSAAVGQPVTIQMNDPEKNPYPALVGVTPALGSK